MCTSFSIIARMRTYWYRTSVRLSVCLFVRWSVRMIHADTVRKRQLIVVRAMSHNMTRTRVFWRQRAWWWWNRIRMGRQSIWFSTKSRYILETAQAMDTLWKTSRKSYLIYRMVHYNDLNIQWLSQTTEFGRFWVVFPIFWMTETSDITFNL